jgi:hypothetical protein
MTPYDLEHRIKITQDALAVGKPIDELILGCLLTLMQHEADKEAAKNIERANADR